MKVQVLVLPLQSGSSFRALNLQICLSLTARCTVFWESWQYLSSLDHFSGPIDMERSDSSKEMLRAMVAFCLHNP